MSQLNNRALWLGLCFAVTAASADSMLRGIEEMMLLDDEPRELMGNGTSDPGRPPVLFYVAMPFVSAIIGWFTNKVALKMTFYPYKFWGPELMRFENQPVGLFGWQGIVPTKAAKMAADSVDLMTTKVFNMQEIFKRIDKQIAAEHLKEGFNDNINKFIDQISTKYIVGENTAWKRTEKAVKEQIKTWALDELPAFTYSFMDALVDDLDEVYDLKHMCVTEMTEKPQLLVSVFESVGKKELLFIEHSGAYFGFIFGFIQTMLFAFAIPSPYADYLLPFLGFLVGYATNYIALWMIFKPIFPKKLCGGRFVIHGLFLKRQKEASKQFAIKMVDTVLHSENIWHYMLHGPKAAQFEALLRRHTDEFTAKLIGFTEPLVIAYLGANEFEAMKRDVQELTVKEIENIMEYMHEYTDQALDLEEEIAVKMGALPSDEFERVLHPVFEEDELKLILVGAFLGVLVGSIQMVISLALTNQL